MEKKELSVLVTFEEGHLVAQCLDYDIAVQADNHVRLMRALQMALLSNVLLSIKHGEEPFSNLTKAPMPYWKAFERAAVNIDFDLTVSNEYSEASLPALKVRAH